MVRIKHTEEEKKQPIELSIGEKVVHNSYYIPRRTTTSKIYKDYTTYEGFGYGLADRIRTIQQIEEELEQKSINQPKKRVLKR